MKRKRFIKLLMGAGISRNKAIYVARRIRRIGIPYARVHWITVFMLAGL